MPSSISPQKFELIRETQLNQIFYLPGVSPYIVTTFAPRCMLADGQTWWGCDVLSALNIEAIGIVPRFAHWYPAADKETVESARVVLEKSGKRTRIGYGWSMGAFGAIKHAGALALTDVIALAPVWSIDRNDLVSESPWKDDFDQSLSADMRICSRDVEAANVYAFFDPKEPDEHYHARKICEVVDASRFFPIEVRFTGHDVVSSMLGAGQFSSAMSALAGQRSDASTILRSLARSGKKKTEHYYYCLCLHLLRRQHRRRLKQVLLRGLTLFPNSICLASLLTPQAYN